MHRLLRERNVDALAVEEFVDALLHVEICGPIVLSFHPCADGEVHAAVGERVHANEGRLVGGLFQNLLQRIEIIEEHGADALHVFAVVNTYRPLHAAQFFARIVHHHGGAHRAVGRIDQFVVGRGDDGVEDLDFAHGALHALRFNPVAHTVGAEEQDDDAAGEVLQVARERHAHCHACRGEEGCERRGVHAERADDRDNEEYGEQDIQQTHQKALDTYLYGTAVEHATHDFSDKFYNITSYYIYEHGSEHTLAGTDAGIDKILDKHIDVVDAITLDGFKE